MCSAASCGSGGGDRGGGGLTTLFLCNGDCQSSIVNGGLFGCHRMGLLPFDEF